MAKDVVYELKLVGGPHDGTRGLVWRKGIEYPLPDLVLVGFCAGEGACTASERECRQLGHGKQHVAYWLAEEADEEPTRVPDERTVYELYRTWVEGGGQYGIAAYTISGLQLPKGETAADAVWRRSTDPVYA